MTSPDEVSAQIDQLPAAAIQQILGDQLSSLPNSAKAEILGAQLDGMPEEQKKNVAKAAGIPWPSGRELGGIWRILLFGLTFIGLAGVGGGITLAAIGKPADAAWAVATAVVGGLVGLLAPSPAQG